MQVYQRIMTLPLGAGLKHPLGVLTPQRLPHFEHGSWHVHMPLASHSQPRSEEQLRWLVADVLHGLESLHDLGIAHWDVRPPNILQVISNLFLLS